MSIVTAMNVTSLLKASHAYRDAGVSVVPVKSKVATVHWREFQARLPKPGELTTWFSRRDVTGLAIITGGVSRNLVIVDLDGRAAATAYGREFPHLRQTLIVASANGWHCYYHVDSLPETTRLVNGPGGVKEIGLRAGGHYTVAPPSVHPSGVRYTPIRGEQPLRVPNLDDVALWLKSQRQTPTSAALPGKPTPTSTGENPRYVNAVLRRELDHVRYAVEGTRNDNLYHAARRLASLCANPDSGLSESSVRASLAAAAARLASDDGEQSVLRTIESGWQTGAKSPRDIPGMIYG